MDKFRAKKKKSQKRNWKGKTESSPELTVLIAKKNICRTLGRNIEVRSINSEALKERRSNEVRSVRFY